MTDLRVLVFGAAGQVGRELCALDGLAALPVTRAEADLSVKGAARARILSAGADAVINAAAYTAVDRAESEPDLARRINADAAAEIAQAAAEKGLPLIHFSTDYVFDGTATRPLREDDPTAPLGVYGETKREGEERVIEAGGRRAILRLSWVFSPHGANFVKTMLRLSAERPALRVVADQRGKPTPAFAAAEAARLALAGLLRGEGASGVYHVAGDEATSWADFAEAVVAAAGRATPVARITTAEFPTPARRPAYSVLDTEKFESAFGWRPPSWRDAVADTVRRLGAAG